MASPTNQLPTLKESKAKEDIFDPHKPSQTSFTTESECIWEPMLSTACANESEIFLGVMHNLIRNPNIMSSHLFRADILYDSQKDKSIGMPTAATTTAAAVNPGEDGFSDFTKHMRKELRPIYAPVLGFQWQQTYVRQLVPRNRQLDEDLIQTCHFYVKQSQSKVEHLILYVPHVSDVAKMPWYHPKVKQVAFLHESALTPRVDADAHEDTGLSASATSGTISVHFCLFPDYPLDQRLERTALNLLVKIHKHCRGNKAGYVKRGGHDQILPQQRFQDTYARLKAKYAKNIIDNWVEETDPSKHVFEDLGIAAFLIELWADMYDCGDLRTTSNQEARVHAKPDTLHKKFPGFVDIGCGNGLLTNILNLEGYPGWGFDARKRKTWETFGPEISSGIREMVLVPEVLHAEDDQGADGGDDWKDDAFHNGMFLTQDGSEPPFVVSNHADELTPWTPLIAYLNGTSFIAIPCCSHNLAGARFRAPASKKAAGDAHRKDAAPHQRNHDNSLQRQQAAETGSLKKPPAAKKEPSAYATLCDYVTGLANEVGFSVKKEMLRIPSTRNACLLGVPLSNAGSRGECSIQAKRELVCQIISREVNMPVEMIGKDWIQRDVVMWGPVWMSNQHLACKECRCVGEGQFPTMAKGTVLARPGGSIAACQY